MNHPIPATVEEITALRQNPVTEELVAAATLSVVQLARARGQTLDELTAEVLEEDGFLDRSQRFWLSQIIQQAWACLPPFSE